jgi:hypothetical protein
MAYTLLSMHYALKQVAIKKGEYVPVDPLNVNSTVRPYQGAKTSLFKGDDAVGKVDNRLRDKFALEVERGKKITVRNQNFLNDLAEYCWLVYSKALSAGDAQLIGRTGDLWVPERLERAGIKDKDSAEYVLWNPNTKGNIQKMDKWSPNVNDCWVLGGIHRLATFELVSDLVVANLWDFGQKFHVVTAREILGLLHFGYRFEKYHGKLALVCVDSAVAKDATIEEYDDFMATEQHTGPESIRCLLTAATEHLKLDLSIAKGRLRPVPLTPVQKNLLAMQ